MTADQLAGELKISGKTLRAWLREAFPDEAPGQGRHWDIQQRHIAAAYEWRGIPLSRRSQQVPAPAP